MASSKLSALVSLGANQVPTDLLYIDDVSAGAAGSKSITPNDLLALITRNITDGALRFGAFAAPAVSGAAQGAIYFDSATNRLLFSENAGAYIRIGNVTGPAAATDEALTRFDGATGRLIQNSNITLNDAGVLTFPDDIRQVFNPGATVAGLNVGALAGDPSTPINGDLWYDSTGNLLRARINGATVSLGAGGGGTPGGADTQIQFNNAGAFDGVTGFTSNGTNVTAGSGNLRATRPQFTTSIDDSAGNEFFLLTATGSAVNEFAVANAATGNGPILSATGSDANVPITVSPKGAGILESTGPLRLSGSGSDTFTTPAANNVPTKINIPVYDPGAFGQIVAMGIGNIGTNRRVLSLFDARTVVHQPTLAIFTPDENNLAGFSWEGSNSELTFKTTVTNGVIRFSDGTSSAQVLIAPAATSAGGGFLHVVSASAGGVALRADSAATPTVDIARFTINGSTSVGTYTGIAKGGTVFTPRNAVTGAAGGTTNLDFSLGNIQQFTFGAGNETLTFSNIPNSAKLTIVIIQDGTGSRTLTWPATAKFIGGVAPTLSAAAGARDIINFYSDGTNIYQTSAIALAVA